jgi:DNA-directed RNA polymerase subunit RPC12/RpoP
VKTDKSEYRQGEAVTISGEVTLDGKPTPPDKIGRVERALAFNLYVPGMPADANNAFSFSTNEWGRYSFMPFAGWNTGKYTVKVKCALTTDSGRFTANGETSFEVKKAQEVLDMTAQLRQITALYVQQVREGPIRTAKPEQLRPFLDTGDNAFMNPNWFSNIPEQVYGRQENMFLDRTELDPGGDFVCGGYCKQVVKFFNDLRFNKDPQVRDLLKGLDCGPIERGLAFGGYLPLTYHTAVVLYPMNLDWTSIFIDSRMKTPGLTSKVFDPWVTQSPKHSYVDLSKPAIYELEEFIAGWGFLRVSDEEKSVTNPKLVGSGCPLTGGYIYANPNVFSPQQGISPPRPGSQVGVDCPVDVLLTDSKGKRVGALPDGTFVGEFPAFAERYTDGKTKEVVGWYFELPQGVYKVAITGRSTGTFQLQVRDQVSGGRSLDYGSQSISKGAQAKITVGAGDLQPPPLTMPDGKTITPHSKLISQVTTQTTRVGTTQATTQTTGVGTGQGDGDGGVAMLIIICVIIAVVAFAVRRRGHAKPSPIIARSQTQPVPPSTITEPPSLSGGFCINCGAQIKLGKHFCEKCGTPATPIPQTNDQPTGITCSNCGSRIPAGKKFCTSCGKRLAAS